MPDARFPDRLRLPLEFEPARLAADMAQSSAAGWIAHFVTQNYDGDWSVIALRGPAGAQHPVQMIYSDPTCTDFDDTPMLAGCALFPAGAGRFACPLQAVRLMRLAPGSLIKEHRDHDLSFEEGMVRIHIPVTTNEGGRFPAQRPALRHAGRFDLVPAAVRPAQRRQPGPTDRVHLVIDAVVNDWVAALFERAVGPPAAGRREIGAVAAHPAPYMGNGHRRAFWPFRWTP